MPEMLVFKMFSGGEILIDRDKCHSCLSKACIKVCNSDAGNQVLDLEEEIPILKKTIEEIKKGGCNECLGCELDCSLFGKKAITINLPIDGFENITLKY